MLDRYKDRYQIDIKIDTRRQKDRYQIDRKIDTRQIERQILDRQKD